MENGRRKSPLHVGADPEKRIDPSFFHIFINSGGNNASCWLKELRCANVNALIHLNVRGMLGLSQGMCATERWFLV